MTPSEAERLAADMKPNEAVRIAPEHAQAGNPHATPRAREASKHADVWANALGEELTDDELDGVVGGLSPD